MDKMSLRRSAVASIVVLALGLSASMASGAADEGERIINDCGVNSLYLLLRLRSTEVDLAELRRTLPDTEAQGLSMAEIGAASGRYGVPLRGRRLGPDDVPIDRPTIALLKPSDGQGHYVVLEPVGFRGRAVMVLDFPRPPRIVDYADLMRGGDWTGLALVPVTLWDRSGPWISSGTGVLLVLAGLAPVWKRRRAARSGIRWVATSTQNP